MNTRRRFIKSIFVTVAAVTALATLPTMPKRRDILSRDIPIKAEGGIILRPTNSPALYLQQFGRARRCGCGVVHICGAPSA